MGQYNTASLDSDANHYRFGTNSAFRLLSPWTFTDTTTGAVGAHTLFTVTGDVLVSVFGHCTTDVTGSGTGEVGTANNTAGLIAQTTGTAIDANEWWQNGTPTLKIGADVNPVKPIGTSTDIILTIGTDTFTAGVITFYCLFRPLSSDGNISVTIPA